MSLATLVLASAWLVQQGATPPPGQGISKDLRLADFHQFVNTFQKFYAMEELKLRTLGVDIRDPRSNGSWVNRIEKEEMTDNQFAGLLVDWAQRLKDGHVTVSFPFNWSATLPLEVDFYDQSGLEPKNAVRLTWVDRRLLPENDFPVPLGYELKSIDDEPVSVWMDRFRPFVSTGSSTGTNRLAARMLVQRYAAIMPGVQQDVREKAKLDFVDFDGNPIPSIFVSWITAGDKDRKFVPGIEPAFLTASGGPVAEMPASRAKLLRTPVRPFYALPTWRAPARGAFFYDVIVGDEGNPLRSVDKGDRYGLIRIPTFALSISDRGEWDKRVSEFRDIVKRMQQEQVRAIVIDILENPGGSVWLCQELLRAVAGLERNVAVFSAPLFRIRASYSWLDAFDSYQYLLPTVADKLRAQQAMIYARQIGDQRTLTDPIPLNMQASELLAADPWNRSTPLYVLVDDLTLSAGDLFASVISDQKLGTVIGVRTMGAGGTVGVQPATLATEASLTITQSVMLSPVEGSGAREIENQAVVPKLLLDLRTEGNVRELAKGVRPPFLCKLLAILSGRDPCVAPPAAP